MTNTRRRNAVWSAVLGISLVAGALALRPEAGPESEPVPPLRALFAESERVAEWDALEWGQRDGLRRLDRGAGWDPAVVDALRLLRNARLERPVGERAADGERYGLAPPARVLRIARRGRAPEAVLEVGDAAPDGMSVFVSSVGSGEIAKLPLYQIENLDTLFAD